MTHESGMSYVCVCVCVRACVCVKQERGVSEREKERVCVRVRQNERCHALLLSKANQFHTCRPAFSACFMSTH